MVMDITISVVVVVVVIIIFIIIFIITELGAMETALACDQSMFGSRLPPAPVLILMVGFGFGPGRVLQERRHPAPAQHLPCRCDNIKMGARGQDAKMCCQCLKSTWNGKDGVSSLS